MCTECWCASVGGLLRNTKTGWRTPWCSRCSLAEERIRFEVVQDRLHCVRSGSKAILEFQWIKVRSFIEVIDIFDAFEPQGYSECGRQQENLHTDFYKARDYNAFCQYAIRYHPPQTKYIENGCIQYLPA